MDEYGPMPIEFWTMLDLQKKLMETRYDRLKTLRYLPLLRREVDAQLKQIIQRSNKKKESI